MTKGKKNIYVCERCREHIVTVDKDDGVTPFIIRCRATEGCKGSMHSSMYRVFDQSMNASFEWYKPSAEERMGLNHAAKDHVDKGGLLIRPSHVLFKKGDKDAPDAIKDRNGDIVLGLCKKCGRGERELIEPCTPRQVTTAIDPTS